MTLGLLLISSSSLGRSADKLFKEAKTKLDNLNGIIYSNIIHAHWLVVAGYQIHKHRKLKKKQKYNLSLNDYCFICLLINHVRALNCMHFCSQSGNIYRAHEMEDDGIDLVIIVFERLKVQWEGIS